MGAIARSRTVIENPYVLDIKIWYSCTVLGYQIQAKSSQDASTGNTIPELGIGGSIIIVLLAELCENKYYSLYTDNFFT